MLTKTAITLILLGVSVVVGIPCLCFGTLGLTGRLADVSPMENVLFGLHFYGIALLAILPTAGWMWFFLWRPRINEVEGQK